MEMHVHERWALGAGDDPDPDFHRAGRHHAADTQALAAGRRFRCLWLGACGVDAAGFRLSSLGEAINKLYGLDVDGVAALTGISRTHSSYLLSDLLLVEGLLLATGGVAIRVAEIDLTNVPGLLADDRTFAWGNKYGCYLDRLKADGAATYASDPSSCD